MPSEKTSAAIEPGKVVLIDAASTPVISESEADPAQAIIFQNNSDEYITIRPAAAGAEPYKGIVLAPGVEAAAGGAWREENSGTAWCACSHGSDDKSLSVVIL